MKKWSLVPLLFILFILPTTAEKASGSRVLANGGQNSIDQLMALKAPFQLSYSIKVKSSNEKIDVYLVDDYNYQMITKQQFEQAQYVVGGSAINTAIAEISKFDVMGTKTFHLVVANRSLKNPVMIEYLIDAEARKKQEMTKN